MSFLGSLVGAVSSYANQQQALQNSKELTAFTAQTNYKYAKKSAQNSPSWNRAGLEKANYNPMLAVQNATSGANSSWTSNASAPMADITSGMSNATQALQAKARLDNETRQTDSTVASNEASAEESRARASNLRALNPFISKREEAEIKQTEANTSKLQSERDNINAQTQYIDDYYELERKKAELIKRGQDLNFAGIKYSSDNSLFGSIYNTDSNERNNIRTNRTQRGRITGPFGVSTTFGALNRDMNDYYDFIPLTRHNYRNRYFRDY